MHSEEHLLVERASQGDVDSYSTLVTKYSNAVYAIAYGIVGDFHEAQDIAQEVFVKAWHNLNRIRRSKQKLKEELVELVQDTLSTQMLGKEFEQRVVKRITGVACINLPVSNVDASKKWYVDHLGCTLVRDTLSFNGAVNCLINLGEGPTVLLHEEKEKYNLHFMRNGEPAPIFELLTEDIKEFYHQLKKEGVTVIGDITNSSCGDRFQVNDPDGNRITIIQC